MRLLILQGSFRQDKGITGMVTDRFIKGMKNADPSAEIRIEYLAGRAIEECRGCFGCWVRTPGICCIKDDMQQIIEEFRSSDVIIAATPVYIDSMSSYMKKAWERLLPAMEPYFEYDGVWVRHRARSGKPKALFVISTCAMPELQQFDALLQTFRRISHNFSMDFLGQLLRPEAHSLSYVKKYEAGINEVLEGMEKCGGEFIKNLSIAPETLEKAQQPIMESPGDFLKINNRMWDGMIEKNIKAGSSEVKR